VSSLRVRFSLAFALTAGVACLVIGLIVYQQTAAGLIDRARDRAAQEARSARDLGAFGSLPLGSQLDTESVPPALVARVSSGHVATILSGAGSGERVWAGAYLARDNAGVYVSDSLAPQNRELGRLRSTLLYGGLIATGVAALIGITLAIWLSARLRRAARIARRIAAGRISERILLRGRDEIASLALAIDDMADELEQQIVRERRFAGDAAHELRTPVAGIVASSQLLPESPAARMVRDGATQLHRLVDQLLELARLESDLDAISVDEVDLQRVALAAQTVYPDIVVEAAGPAIVKTDLRRLERILANLIENALGHGAGPVTLHVSETRIAVSDHGPGFPPDLIEHATERFRVGDEARAGGVGLGLSISAEHARLLATRLEIMNLPNGGCVVGIDLPRVSETASVPAE
jgi:two-component system sensor histidine kinase MtrB